MTDEEKALEAQQKLEKEAAAAKEEEKKAAEAKSQEDAKKSQEDVVKRIETLRTMISSQSAPADIDKQYEQIEEETGLTRKQVDYFGGMIEKSVARATSGFAQTTGKGAAEKTLGAGNEALMAQVEEVMGNQPESVKANTDAWVNAAHIVRSKNMGTIVKGDGNSGTGGGGTTIKGGNVSGLGRPTSSGGEQKPTYEGLSESQKFICDKYFGGQIEEMSRYTKEKGVETLNPGKKFTIEELQKHTR